MQIETEDTKLSSVYSEQIKNLKTEKDLANAKLKEFGDTFDATVEAKLQANTIQQNIKALDRAWGKASFFLKKKLLKAMFEKIIVTGSKVQITFSTLKTTDFLNSNNDYKGVSANEAETSTIAKLMDSFNFSGFFKNALVNGGPIGEIGCGGRI